MARRLTYDQLEEHQETGEIVLGYYMLTRVSNYLVSTLQYSGENREIILRVTSLFNGQLPYQNLRLIHRLTDLTGVRQ